MNKKIILGIVALVMCTTMLSTTAMSAGLLDGGRSSLESKKVIFTTIKTCEASKGWKYFSLPFDAAISKDKLMIQAGSKLLTFNQAVEKGIVDPTIFVFNNELQRWDIATILEAGKGYIVYVYADDGIILKAAGSFKMGLRPIMLSAGWDYFGITVNKPIALSHVLINGLTLRDAAKKGIVEASIFHYNEVKGWFNYLNVDKDCLMPGEVYMIYSYQDNVELSFC